MTSNLLSVRDTWIINATPFIGLAKIGRLELLTSPERQVFLPQIVSQEIAAGKPNDPCTLAISPNRLKELGIIILPSRITNQRVSAFSLDKGEAAVLRKPSKD